MVMVYIYCNVDWVNISVIKTKILLINSSIVNSATTSKFVCRHYIAAMFVKLCITNLPDFETNSVFAFYPGL